MFILSDSAIDAIINTQGIRPKICLALGISEQTVYRIYSRNDVNNDLTKYAVLELLREETGLEYKMLVKKVPVNSMQT